MADRAHANFLELRQREVRSNRVRRSSHVGRSRKFSRSGGGYHLAIVGLKR